MSSEIRTTIGTTDIGSRPDASIVWYWDSCNEDRGTPEIQKTSTSEAEILFEFMQAKKPETADYDIKLYIALAVWNTVDGCWDIIDDEVIDSWNDED